MIKLQESVAEIYERHLSEFLSGLNRLGRSERWVMDPRPSLETIY